MPINTTPSPDELEVKFSCRISQCENGWMVQTEEDGSYYRCRTYVFEHSQDMLDKVEELVLGAAKKSEPR